MAAEMQTSRLGPTSIDIMVHVLLAKILKTYTFAVISSSGYFSTPIEYRLKSLPTINVNSFYTVEFTVIIAKMLVQPLKQCARKFSRRE